MKVINLTLMFATMAASTLMMTYLIWWAMFKGGIITIGFGYEIYIEAGLLLLCVISMIYWGIRYRRLTLEEQEIITLILTGK